MQEAFQEQEQESDSRAAPSNHKQPAGASQRPTPRQQAGATQGAPPHQLPLSQHQTPAIVDLHRAAQGSTQGPAQESAKVVAQSARSRAAKNGNGYLSGGDGANDLASRNAQSASSQDDEILQASRQEPQAAVHAVQQDNASQQKWQAGASQLEAEQTGDAAEGPSSRSIDGDDDGMLDRFGSVDIITGRPVRDLKLDPVRQLVKWRESLFGSRDSVSESLDKDDEDPST